MSEAILQIKHLEKSFGTHQVLKDIDFEVQKGEVISVIGSSWFRKIHAAALHQYAGNPQRRRDHF